ncbi:MAG TPA: AbiV family abortive infection protein, partial [Bacteroidales bacterium]|nr:AbiV family abortive infection protein [Bacteroidales bacterium]
MNYELLSDLDDYQILEGMTAYFDNAKDLFETGENLAIQQKYGIATALTIFSIEELIKSYATFLFYTGVKDEEIIDLTFKGGNIHKKRLKIAFANAALIDFFNEVNLEDIFNKVTKIKNLETD